MGHIYLKECYVEKIFHYDALQIWKEIEENRKDSLLLGLSGIEYTLDGEGLRSKSKSKSKSKEKEEKVTSDAKTVSVWFKYRDKEKKAEIVKQIGELSEDDSKIVVDFIRQGWAKAFSAYISYFKNDADEDKSMKIVIYIEEK